MAVLATQPFVPLAPAFNDVLGDSPRLEHVVELDAHEGPVYAPLRGRAVSDIASPSRGTG